jgi:hypothetical protein
MEEVKAIKKGIIVLLAVYTAAAWGTDLNPQGNNKCGAGSVNTDPSTITGEAQFGVIYANLSVKIGDEEMYRIITDDTTFWESDVLPDKNWSYLMVKFVKPQGYNGGTLNWCVTGTTDADVYAYRWNKNPTPHEWTYMNKNDGGVTPPTKTYSIPASYFDGNGVLWLLFKVNQGTRHINADVVDIQW